MRVSKKRRATPKRQAFFCLLPAACCLLPSAAQPPRQEAVVSLPANALLPTTLPLANWNGLPVVVGSVGGSQERFVLDTGLDANALMPWAQERFKLTPSEKQVRVTVMDVARDAPEVQLPVLQIGTLRLEKLPATLLDVFGALSLRPHPDAPLGWFGTPFLSAFQVTFDFTNRLVMFNAPDAALPNPKGTKTADLTLHDGRAWVKVTVPGVKPFEAYVNTGSPGTLLPTEVVQSLKLTPKQTSPLLRGEGKAEIGLYVVPKFGVAGAEVKDMRVLALLPGAGAEFDAKQAVLGSDFLQRFKVTLSYAKKKIALSPNVRLEAPPPPTPDDGDG